MQPDPLTTGTFILVTILVAFLFRFRFRQSRQLREPMRAVLIVLVIIDMVLISASWLPKSHPMVHFYNDIMGLLRL